MADISYNHAHCSESKIALVESPGAVQSTAWP